jgi:pimeloyl-ACP methyl ester carboxylesterase
LTAWEGKPFNPLRALPADYRLIAMDQRNAGQSWAPISAQDGWNDYTNDQLALMDHLGFEKFHVVGMCIGGAYAMNLINAAAARIASAVLLQPIGLENNRHAFLELADAWREGIRERHPEAEDSDYDSFVENMFGGDFLFSATPDDVVRSTVPLLVLLGNDLYHPSSVSRRVAESARYATLVEQWKEEPHLTRAHEQIAAFLARHTPRP